MIFKFDNEKVFEYKTMQGDSLPSAENLNELSKEGWELVQIVPVGILVYIYLKRERKQ